MNHNLLARVTSIVRETLNLSDKVTLEGETHLQNDVGLDSMTSLALLVALEERIEGFSVDPMTLTDNDLMTINHVVHYVESSINTLRG